MNVDEIMTRQTITIEMDDSVRKAKEIFERHKFHHLLVVEKKKLMGVISDRDLLLNLSPFIGTSSERPQDMATLNRRVHQIMSRTPITVSAETTVEAAAQRMLAERVSCLPVTTEDDDILGIVTWRDLLRGLCGPTRA